MPKKLRHITLPFMENSLPKNGVNAAKLKRTAASFIRKKSGSKKMEKTRAQKNKKFVNSVSYFLVAA